MAGIHQFAKLSGSTAWGGEEFEHAGQTSMCQFDHLDFCRYDLVRSNLVPRIGCNQATKHMSSPQSFDDKMMGYG